MPQPQPAAERRPLRMRLRQTQSTARVVALFATCIFASMLLAAWHTAHYPRLSPYDEQAHVDNYLKIRHGHVLRPGELMGQEGLHEANCRGLDSAYVPPPCDPGDGGRHDPRAFVWHGINTSSAHLPTYYAITALIAAPVTWLFSVNDPVDAGRIATGAWLGAALAFLYLALGNLGVPRLARVGACLMLAATPVILLMSATINPDGAALLSGAAVLWMLTRTQSFSYAGLMLMGCVATITKPTNIIIAAAALVPVVLARSPSLRTRAARAVALGFGAFAYPFLWVVVQHFRVLDTGDTGIPTDTFSLRWMIDTLDSFAPPTLSYGTQQFLATSVIVGVAFAWMSAVLMGSSLAAAVGARVGSRLRHIGIGTLLMLVFGSLFINIFIFASLHDIIITPPRYGLGLVPLMLAGLALVKWTRPVQAIWLAFGATVFVNVVVQISHSTYTMIGKL